LSKFFDDGDAFGVSFAFGVGRLVVFRPPRGTALFLPAATFGRR